MWLGAVSFVFFVLFRLFSIARFARDCGLTSLAIYAFEEYARTNAPPTVYHTLHGLYAARGEQGKAQDALARGVGAHEPESVLIRVRCVALCVCECVCMCLSQSLPLRLRVVCVLQANAGRR